MAGPDIYPLWTNTVSGVTRVLHDCGTSASHNNSVNFYNAAVTANNGVSTPMVWNDVNGDCWTYVGTSINNPGFHCVQWGYPNSSCSPQSTAEYHAWSNCNTPNIIQFGIDDVVSNNVSGSSGVLSIGSNQEVHDQMGNPSSGQVVEYGDDCFIYQGWYLESDSAVSPGLLTFNATNSPPYNSNPIPWPDCSGCGAPPAPTWNCSGQFGVSLLDGTLISPYTCWDPGDGTGTYGSIGLCNQNCTSPCLQADWDPEGVNPTNETVAGANDGTIQIQFSTASIAAMPTCLPEIIIEGITDSSFHQTHILNPSMAPIGAMIGDTVTIYGQAWFEEGDIVLYDEFNIIFD